MMPRIKTTTIAIALFALSNLFMIWMRDDPEFIRFQPNDGSHFYTLAHNLASQFTYSDDTYPDDGLQLHATWPPLWPMVLSATHFIIDSPSLKVLKTLTLVIAVLNLFVLRKLFDELTSPDDAKKHQLQTSTLITLATLCSPIYFAMSRTIMSEALFLLLSNLTLSSLLSCSSQKQAALSGLLAGLTFLTRGYAILFVPLGFFYFLFYSQEDIRKRVTHMTCFAIPLGICGLSWFFWTDQVIGLDNVDYITRRYGSTAGSFTFNASLTTLKYQYLPALGEHASPWFFSNSQRSTYQTEAAAVGLLFLFPTLVGCAKQIKGRANPVVLWGFLGILYLMNSKVVEVRYWLIWFPAMLYLCLHGLDAISSRLKLPSRRQNQLRVTILLLCFSGLVPIFTRAKTESVNDYWSEYVPVLDWIEKNTEKNAIFVAAAPEKIFTHTSRSAIFFDGITFPTAAENLSSFYAITYQKKAGHSPPMTSFEKLIPDYFTMKELYSNAKAKIFYVTSSTGT